MNEPKRVGLKEARFNLADLVNRARYKRETFLISKHGEPLALLIPIDTIPTLYAANVLTPAQKKFGALARMVPAESKS